MRNKFEIDSSDKNLDVDFYVLYSDYPYMHNHEYWEFFVVLKGSYKHVINGKTIIAHKNSGWLIRPDDYHGIYNNEENSSHINVIIKPEFMKAICDLYSEQTFNLLISHDEFPLLLSENQTQKIVEYASQLSNNYSVANDKKLIAHLLVCYVLEKAISQNSVVEDEKPKWLNELLLQINSPNNNAWQVEDIVAYSNYSHSHLARVFKQYMNCSVVSYLTKTKMSNAQDYLMHSELSMSDLAALLGYNSLSRFNHVFKEYFNMSPTQYKKMCRNRNQ